MLVTFYLRVKGGWKQERQELTPEELNPIRRALVSKLRERIAKNPGKIPFDVTPVGEKIYGCATGTLTELSNAGICVGCLGSGKEKNKDYPDNDCEFCRGSGNCS